MSSPPPAAPHVSGPLEHLPQDELEFSIPNIIPFDVQWGQNGLRQADTMTFKVRFADFPLDPRLMRAIAVKFYLGTVTAQQSAAGLNSTNANDFLIPDSWIDDQGRMRSNLRFKGWVDVATMVYPEEDEPYVEFTCRDNTSLLIEQEMPPKFTTPDLATHPIDQAIAELLTNFPQMEGLAVEYRPAGATPPSLDGALQNTAHRPNLGPVQHLGGGGASGAGAGAGKLSVWDYIADITGSIGHVARIEGDTIIVQSVRTATSSNYPQRGDDPYTPLEVNGVKFPVRTLVYGRDLQDLNIKRNYTKPGLTNIEIRSYNAKLATKVLVARYPETPAERVVHVGIGASASTKWTVVRVSGFDDVTKLRALAQAYYENMGRQEISISAKTQDLASFGGDGANPDLLDVRAGDTLQVLFRRRDAGTFQTFAHIEEIMSSTAAAEKFLTTLGFESKFATTYAQQFQNAGFQNNFRVRTVGVACTYDEGVSLEFDLMNYIEVRGDKIAKNLSTDDPAQKDGGHGATNGLGSTPNKTPAVPVPTTSTSPVMNPSDPKYKQAAQTGNPSIRDLNKQYTSQQIDKDQYMQGLSDHYNKGEVFEP